MDDELFVTIIALILVLVVVSLLQLLLLKFTSLIITIIASLGIAVVISFLYVSFSNYGSINNGWTSDFVTTTLKVFFCLLTSLLIFILYKQDSASWNKKLIIIPQLAIIVYLLSNYIYQYIEDSNHFYNSYSECELSIINETNKKPIFNSIALVSEEIGIVKRFTFGINENQKTLHQNSYALIPVQTDEIRFYTNNGPQVFEFEYKLLNEKVISKEGIDILLFWLKNKINSPIKLSIQSDNKVDLYIDNKYVKSYEIKD